MKKYSKIILAGGSGQIGKALCHHFKNSAETIIILSRASESTHENIRTVHWDGATIGPWAKELENADMLINLTGKNVNCRYNAKNKQEIISSRVNSINVLSAAISQTITPPKLFIQCASATIYRQAEDRPMTEKEGEIGEGFSVNVCKAWEQTFWEQTSHFSTMRKVLLRISLVLGAKEGVYPRLKNLVRFGLGGKQGNGKQMVSWIHEKDVAGIIEWLATHTKLEGTFNCTSPLPVTNTEMMRTIRKALGMPFGFPSPRPLLELGAFIIGTETELILKSRWVLPENITNSGYPFQLPGLPDAVKDIMLER